MSETTCDSTAQVGKTRASAAMDCYLIKYKGSDLHLHDLYYSRSLREARCSRTLPKLSSNADSWHHPNDTVFKQNGNKCPIFNQQHTSVRSTTRGRPPRTPLLYVGREETFRWVQRSGIYIYCIYCEVRDLPLGAAKRFTLMLKACAHLLRFWPFRGRSAHTLA